MIRLACTLYNHLIFLKKLTIELLFFADTILENIGIIEKKGLIMALNFKKNDAAAADTQTSLTQIRVLNTALNQLQNTQTKLMRAKNAERTLTEQEARDRDAVVRATKSVSSISPATDPNYEESLRKAQEDLMKRSKALEKTIILKNREQTEIALLEKQLIAQEYTVQTTKATLGASGKVYNRLFTDISAVYNQQERLETEIAHAKVQRESEEDVKNAAKKQAVLEELRANLELENKKLSALEARILSGEALFSEPKLNITSSTEQVTDQNLGKPPLLLTSTSILQIFQIITQVPALYIEHGHKAYFKQSIAIVHDYFAFWDKTKFVLKTFIMVAWMSLLAPFETIFKGVFNKMLQQKNQTTPRTFIQWLNPLTLLKAVVGFTLGLIVALVSLPFTTLGAVAALIVGILAAGITLIGILVLEMLCIILLFPLCLLMSALKMLYLPIIHLFKRKT